TAPPKPVGEITFSGGGGKGVALPGAIKALEEKGILKDAKTITGASVGSMTAALVACGITADEFTKVANDTKSTDVITEGTGGSKLGLAWAALKNKATTGSGSPLKGEGLENIVRDVLDETLRLRMTEYMEQCSKDSKPMAPSVVKVMKKLAGNKSGPTFGDMRELSKVIPQIKEVVITGTYTTEFEDDNKGGKKKVKGGNDTGQLYIFSADTEPDLEVAIAVHASASFPVAFKPVDIKLSSGMTVRFIDGGVMNNTPTSSSIGNDRNLDPEPQTRGMTFVFEDKNGKAEEMLDGKLKPPSGKKAKFKDWLTGSSHVGAEYAKNRDAMKRPEEMVIVPLTYEMKPDKKG
ncbi:MAG: patatin-like phospholipase family protein, partial [Gemmataceae bacterium]